MNCIDCREPVTPRNAWAEVIGFEQRRAAGGTNYIAERKPTGRCLCNRCMVLRRSGIPPGQEQLGG